MWRLGKNENKPFYYNNSWVLGQIWPNFLLFWFFINVGVVNRKKIVKIWKLKITKDYYFGEMENYLNVFFFVLKGQSCIIL